MNQTHATGYESPANQTKRAWNTAPKTRYADKTATYWWFMEMNYDQKVQNMTGYGKFEGSNENKTKEGNLMRIIEMLFSKGYFFKTKEINIYERLGLLGGNPDTSKLIVQITNGSIIYFEHNRDVKRFLDNLNNLAHKNIKPLVHLRPLQK